MDHVVHFPPDGGDPRNRTARTDNRAGRRRKLARKLSAISIARPLPTALLRQYLQYRSGCRRDGRMRTTRAKRAGRGLGPFFRSPLADLSSLDSVPPICALLEVA